MVLMMVKVCALGGIIAFIYRVCVCAEMIKYIRGIEVGEQISLYTFMARVFACVCVSFFDEAKIYRSSSPNKFSGTDVRRMFSGVGSNPKFEVANGGGVVDAPCFPPPC